MCYNPLPVIFEERKIINEETGEIYKTRLPHFLNKYDFNIYKKRKPEELDYIPCGKCEECLCSKSAEWSVRSILEAQKWPKNAFLTLTYDNKHIPKKRSLKKKDLQDFWKRLRKAGYKIRYLACGEYGPRTKRPHYHAIVFNFWPNDCKTLHKSINNDQYFTSPQIEKIWGLGYIVIGTVNYETCAYVARYVMKKAYGAKNTDGIYRNGKEPEFRVASRRPGLGYYSTKNEELLRNFGINIKTKTGVKLMPLPTYIRNKLRENFREDYYKLAVKRTHAIKEEARARKTDLNYFDYKLNHDKHRREQLKKLDKRQDFE